MAAVTICSDCGAPKIKSVTVFTVSPSIYHEVIGLDATILVFWMLSFKSTFSLSSFIKRLFKYSFWSWCHFMNTFLLSQMNSDTTQWSSILRSQDSYSWFQNFRNVWPLAQVSSQNWAKFKRQILGNSDASRHSILQRPGQNIRVCCRLIHCACILFGIVIFQSTNFLWGPSNSWFSWAQSSTAMEREHKMCFHLLSQQINFDSDFIFSHIDPVVWSVNLLLH